jgi:hypothetical protein
MNTSLILIPTSNQIVCDWGENDHTHLAFCNKNGEYGLEKTLYEFLSTILSNIDQEAANFADDKNQGIIITFADINIDEGFVMMKNRRNARKLKSLGDMQLLRGRYHEAIDR